jgi:hypothetical protein
MFPTSQPQLKDSFDTKWIKKNVKEISDKINKMELEGKNDPFEFEMYFLESHPEFYQAHPFLVKKLCKRDDLSMLYKMLDNLEKVESGNQSFASVELKLGQELADQYLQPVLNKKLD